MSTTYISIASYRDSKTPATLSSIFKNARYPFNVFVGICLQNAKDDIDCTAFPEYSTYANQIKVKRIPHTEAKGPTFARYLCTQMCQDQDFFLQIDRHSLFVKDWDIKLIEMNRLLEEKYKNKKNIISHYPKCYLEYEKDQSDNKIKETSSFVPRITRAFFNERDMISYIGSEYMYTTKDINGLVETAFTTGGFLFARMSMIKNVPFDPNLDYLFVGEEIIYSARCWTSGYNIFNPNENIVYHYYTRSDEPKFWTDNTVYDDSKAHTKCQILLGIKKSTDCDNDHGKFGMGITRSLNDYLLFAGIDVPKRRIFKNFCKPLDIDPIDYKIEYFIFIVLTTIILFLVLGFLETK